MIPFPSILPLFFLSVSYSGLEVISFGFPTVLVSLTFLLLWTDGCWRSFFPSSFLMHGSGMVGLLWHFLVFPLIYLGRLGALFFWEEERNVWRGADAVFHRLAGDTIYC
jgi:hypothetical protein